MAKDPAVLFYTSDFISGTLLMSDEQKGKYIILLCLQHQKGKLSEEDMIKICKSYDKDIYEKFKKDNEGFYYNERMKSEIDKRRSYSESRSNNRKSLKNQENEKDMINISETYVKHMENENENRNDNIIENEIFKKWNEFSKKNNLSQISKLTDKRISAIHNRLKDSDFDFDKILDLISKSDFLLGKKTDWKIDFDFIFCSKNNYVKILEGKYNNNQATKPNEQQTNSNIFVYQTQGNNNYINKSEINISEIILNKYPNLKGEFERLKNFPIEKWEYKKNLKTDNDFINYMAESILKNEELDSTRLNSNLKTIIIKKIKEMLK